MAAAFIRKTSAYLLFVEKAKPPPDFPVWNEDAKQEGVGCTYGCVSTHIYNFIFNRYIYSFLEKCIEGAGFGWGKNAQRG